MQGGNDLREAAAMGLRHALARSLLGPGALLLALGGCATIEHSMSVGEVAGRTLSTRGAEGAERLRKEIEIDTGIRDFVEKYGRPDYIHVVDRMNLYLFYVDDDMAAKFTRDLIPPSVAQRLGRIPGSLIDMLPKREVDKLVARREAAQRQYARTAKRPVRKPAPASVAPSGLSLSTFDVREIVERLRPPLTAADAGVNGWRKVRFSDGATGRAATKGSTRYEVRTDRLVVAFRMGSTQSALPGSARIEVLRLNSAVFGLHAQSVTDQMMPIVKRVAADRSGRSPQARRVRGRVVRVHRYPSNGLLVYSIGN